MHVQSHQKELILASTSPYRQSLLSRLCIPFICRAPETDETPLPDEAVDAFTSRLAEAKAAAVADDFPDAVVIGSDQAAGFEGHILGKPGTEQAAIQRLMRFSGKEVEFFTSVSVLCRSTGFSRNATDLTTVCFRDLGEAEIRRYVEMDQPLNCAGGFKSEAAGPALLSAIHCTDPTGLIGLPLIALSALLRDAGFHIP